MYQGHLPDGSSVQRHSAGPLYPAVIGVHDKPTGREWFVIYPGKEDHYEPTSEKAAEYAKRCNQERAERNAARAAERARQVQFSNWAAQRNAQGARP